MKYVLVAFCSTAILLFVYQSKADELIQKKRDKYTNQVLAIQHNYYKKLESDIKKSDKCKVIYDQLHSNAQEIFVILGRMITVGNIVKDKMESYSGANDVASVSNYIWPHIIAAPIGEDSRYELFLTMCLQSPDNTKKPGFVNKVGDYKSTIKSNNTQVLLLTELDNKDLYVNWKKENGEWKLFNTNRKLRNNPVPNQTEVKLAAEIIGKIHMLGSLNSKCFKLNNPILSKDDAEYIYKYVFGTESDEMYRKIVKAMQPNIDNEVKLVIRDIEKKGGCEKTSSKVMSVFNALKIGGDMLNSIGNMIFI